MRRPGVSVEDVDSVLRVHVDRVHDAVRRLGVDPETAVEIVQSSALALVDAVASRPEQVPDAVGWWFATASGLARGAAPEVPDLPIGGGVLSTDEDQLVLAETLEELPEQERLALLLRDAYRLPLASVAAALATDDAGAATTIARSRLHAVPLLGDGPAPAVPAHATSLPALARLGEGGPVAPRDATVRRHVQACSACAAVTASQQRVHLLLSGLAVVALPAELREEVLHRAEERARAVLPPAAALVISDEEWDDWKEENRALPPLFAVLGVLLAVALGTGLGVVMSRGADAVLPTASDALPAVTLPPVEAAPPITLPDDLPPPPPIPTPRTTVFYLPPRTAAPAPAPRATAPTSSPSPTTTAATLEVEPTSGPNGATLDVTGLGWPPGSQVTVEYLDPAGSPTGSRATAPVAAGGGFATELVAENPTGEPGRHTVRATNDTTTRTASYDVTS